MPVSFTGSYFSLTKSRDVEDKSATRTGSLAEDDVSALAMGGDDAVTEPSKSARRLFEMSTVLMLASKEKRSVLRRDWRNQRFIKEQAYYNDKAEAEARQSVREREQRRHDGAADPRRQVRIHSDPWTEWRDAHRRRQAEVAREQYLETLQKRPSHTPSLSGFLDSVQPSPPERERSVTPEPRSRVVATLTTHEEPKEHKHHTPVLGMLSAIKREAASLAREGRKHKKSPSSDSTRPSQPAAATRPTGVQPERPTSPPGARQEVPKASVPWPDEERPAKPLRQQDRTNSDLLDQYDDAAVSLMSGFSGKMRSASPVKRRSGPQKTPTWDMHDDMAVHFLSSMSGARSPSPTPVDPFKRSSSPARPNKSTDRSSLSQRALRIQTTDAGISRKGSNGTVSPVSPETPGREHSGPTARSDADRPVPRISISGE